jgi:hypothetical protein
MSRRSAPAGPASDRPATGGASVTRYPVNNVGDLFLGSVFAVLLVTYASIPAWSDVAFGTAEAVILLGLVAGTGIPLASYFLAKEVHLTPNHMRFLPIGVSVPFHELEALTGADFPGLGTVQRVTFRARRSRLKWVPLNLIWVGEFVSIRITGMDGKAFLAELSETPRLPALAAQQGSATSLEHPAKGGAE